MHFCSWDRCRQYCVRNRVKGPHCERLCKTCKEGEGDTCQRWQVDTQRHSKTKATPTPPAAYANTTTTQPATTSTTLTLPPQAFIPTRNLTREKRDAAMTRRSPSTLPTITTPPPPAASTTRLPDFLHVPVHGNLWLGNSLVERQKGLSCEDLTCVIAEGRAATVCFQFIRRGLDQTKFQRTEMPGISKAKKVCVWTRCDGLTKH